MEKISRLIKKELNKNYYKQLVIWCIGSTNIVGDSLGPYVGEILIKTNIIRKAIVKGNLRNPVHYLNIKEELDSIYIKHSNIYSIVVDSSLYEKEYIGKIVVAKNKTILGSSLNKGKYKIGDIAIKGIVGENYKSSFKNIKILERVSKQLIKEMSFKIANQIEKSII